jgi:dTDP-4-dehydrorhamnose reductase
MYQKYKVVFTGGSGRFGSVLRKKFYSKKFFFPSKKELNILSEKSIKKYLINTKPKILVHLAALSRPMNIHEKNIISSINLNIIGTANIVKICSTLNVKIIYFSTNYVYPCKKGFYSENDPLLPFNNYAWSKLGGEAAVQMYKNSLILRVCMTEKPFIHKKAFANVYTNFIYHDEVASILLKILNKKGIINVGGDINSVYNFAKKNYTNVKKTYLKKRSRIDFPLNSSMNINKLKRIVNL